MANDDWHDDWRHRRQGSRARWAQDDAPQPGRRGRDEARLGYGPYARDRDDRQDEDMPGDIARDDWGRGIRPGDRWPDQGQGRMNEWQAGRNRYRGDDYGTGYTPDYRAAPYHDRRDDRGWLDRAGDEVASWFGDDDAEYRRQRDHRRDRRHDMAERYSHSPRRPGWRDDW